MRVFTTPVSPRTRRTGRAGMDPRSRRRTSLRPLAFQLEVGGHGHERVRSPRPELARVRIARDRRILQHPVFSFRLEHVNALERVVEAVEPDLSPRRIDIDPLEGGQERVEILDVTPQ